MRPGLCLGIGLLWWSLCDAADGFIEIVEQQQCDDYFFRLTCRDLHSHIAVLEAWYTAMADYSPPPAAKTSQALFEHDSELNQVYVYSSPTHNGVYHLTNHSFLNVTERTMNDEQVTDIVNEVTDCKELSFSRSYGSWREGRRRVVEQEGSVNLRAPLTYRCAGVNHCNFLLGQDHPRAPRWPAGLVYVKFACFDETLSVHHCNREISAAASGPDAEGYIRTPGYPQFYIGDECRWRLLVHPEQNIRVTLLDISLRSIGPFEDECMDYVTVIDSNNQTFLSSCEQVQLPLQLTSRANSVDVVVRAKSKGAFPKRGVLLHYKSIGCVTLAAPSNGYLVYRNDDVAHYMCNVNRVFVDTRQRARILWCYDDNRWNDTVPYCVEESLLPVREGPVPEVGTHAKLPHEPNMIVDIVIPSLLIVALFIGNAFIVLIIYKYRKRKPEDLEDEFNTIPLGASAPVGNAV